MGSAETILSLLNDAAVSIFGGLLSASFCRALGSRKKCWAFWLGMALMLIPQGAAYLFWDARIRLMVYPVVVHLPLLILLRVLTGKWLWPLVSILSTYLFCQIRRWFALLAQALLPGGETVRVFTELVLTLPLMLLLLRFAAPTVRQMMDRPVKVQCQVGFIAAMYYAFDYLTRVYTDLLSSGNPVVVEFMPTVCGVAYLSFLAYNSAEERKRSHLRQVQNNLQLQMAQATREISALRESQVQASRYRHDLRHHLQYLLTCMENGQTDRARAYIAEINAELESQQVQRYCQNEAANLILSAFAGRAAKAGVKLEVRGDLPASLRASDSDLCIILSNALENALHACLPLAKAGEPCTIDVRIHYVKETGRQLIQITNPCKGSVRFEKGLPVSERPGHGIGTKSIRAVAERYGGGCTFLPENGKFILRAFL